MILFLFWCAIGIVAGTVFGSFFEWALHRYVMHKPIGILTHPFKAHALVHHQIFKGDATYHLIHEKDRKTIPMAWWNGPVIVALCQLPFLIWAFFAHKWGVLCGAAVACTLYFTVYEYMHWCMHLPKKRHVEHSGIFYRLNGHHLLHHRYMHKNFNVVLPLADLCLGTLRLRSKIAFAQPQGPSVPNVQPKEKKLKRTHPAA
jgi:hypothetical protein